MQLGQNIETQKVFEIISLLGMQNQNIELLRKSFRTRAKWIEDTLDFQFKYLEEALTQSEKQKVEVCILELQTLLQKKYREIKVSASYKIAPCCRQECFCCNEYIKYK